MFTSTGLFAGVPCPKGFDCALTNCIFSHEAQETNGDGRVDEMSVSASDSTSTRGTEFQPYDPDSVFTDVPNSDQGADADSDQPPAKRRRIESSSASTSVKSTQAQSLPTSASRAHSAHTTLRVPRAMELKALISGARANKAAEVSENKTIEQTGVSSVANGTDSSDENVKEKPTAIIKTTIRPVSPPPRASIGKNLSNEASTTPPSILTPKSRSSTPNPLSAPSTTTTASAPSTKLSLIPRPVPKPPAQHNIRNQSLQLLFAAMLDLNKQATRVMSHNTSSTISLSKSRPSVAALSPNELTKLALDEEEATALACDDGDSYRLTMGRRINGLKKMKIVEWLSFLTDKLKRNFGFETPPASSLTAPIPKPITSSSNNSSERKPFSSGLPSINAERIILLQLRTLLEPLSAYGYITTPPTALQISAAKTAVSSASNYETCDRCDARFRVYPGRNEDGELTSGGKCTYHWGKVVRPPRKPGQGQQEAYYSCCNGILSSFGCETAPTHVFNVKDPARLGSILQFQETPSTENQKSKEPITFDCEMCYTTLGLELIRLTAVSWPTGDEVIDVLVRPYGEILDLNTRFSGVTKEQWAEAVSRADTGNDDEDIEEGELPSNTTAGSPGQPLRLLPSPAAARNLLFSYLSPSTPLLGHAIDNDLTACRIIHPFIVDTVLLYPHPKGLPIRYGLRMLAGKHLGRAIQQGGEAGHDSKEDALATGDLVKVKVAERWQGLRAKGWRFVEDVLVPPEEASKATL